MLVDKFRELVEKRGLRLTPKEREQLAFDLSKVVRRWLARPDSERDEYLGSAVNRLVQRYKHTRDYEMEVIGRPLSPGNKDDVRSHVSLYFRRALARIEKEAIRAGYGVSLDNAGQAPMFHIKSIDQEGGSHRVVSHFRVPGVPPHVVRRGVLIASRKGVFKVAKVRVEELATS
jgi:hypothetical protein